MKIKHEVLGELKISYKKGLAIEINNADVKFETKYLSEDKCVLKFIEEQIINNKKVPGVKITAQQYRDIQKFEKAEIENFRLNEYKQIKGFSWFSTSKIHTFSKYPAEVVKKAQEIIKEKFGYTVKNVDTTAGIIGEITVKNVTGADVIEILEDLMIEVANRNKTKEEESKKRIEDLKKKAKETGERQVVSVTTDDYNDDNEKCDIDTITEYVDADGKFTTVRTHNW